MNELNERLHIVLVAIEAINDSTVWGLISSLTGLSWLVRRGWSQARDREVSPEAISFGEDFFDINQTANKRQDKLREIVIFLTWTLFSDLAAKEIVKLSFYESTKMAQSNLAPSKPKKKKIPKKPSAKQLAKEKHQKRLGEFKVWYPSIWS